MALGDYMTETTTSGIRNVMVMCNIDRKRKKRLNIGTNDDANLLSECSTSHCKYCIKNYIWFYEYCMLCEDGYYADMHSG